MMKCRERQLTDMVANLAARVAKLERRVAELESKKKQPKIRTRKDIVLQARRDVENLIDVPRTIKRLNGFEETYYPGSDSIKFIVNREKQTVVALVKMDGFKGVQARGIAKCHPNDVFNADIGKAIALRRALGLRVPTEYLNAPPPEGIRYGDVVRIEGEPPFDDPFSIDLKIEDELDIVHALRGRVTDDTDREDYREKPDLGGVNE